MEQKFIITTELANKIAQYLGGRPWVESNDLLQKLLTLQPYVEPVAEKVEDKVAEEKG